MTEMRFTVLPVGQGTGTLIEVVGDNGIPLEVVLVDLGSLGWHAKAGFPSVAYVVDRLKLMPEPTLAHIFISHGDADHYNLLPDVLRPFKKPSEKKSRKETLEVRAVSYAGDPDPPAGSTDRTSYQIALEEIDEWRPLGVKSVLKSFASHFSDLAKPYYPSPLGPRYFVMSANALKEQATVEGNVALNKGAPGYLKNLASLVLAVAYGSTVRWIVATGDATGLTMAHCINVLKKANDFPVGIASITLPHHGSIPTTYNVLGAGGGSKKQKDALAKENALNFVRRLQPQSLSVSSGESTVYKLPGARTLGDFGQFAEDSPYSDPALQGEHFYTAYFKRDKNAMDVDSGGQNDWPPENGWYTARTKKAAFTTHYFRYPADQEVPSVFPPGKVTDVGKKAYLPVPPLARGWQWVVPASGSGLTIVPVLEIPSMSAEYRAFLEARGVEIPEGRFMRLPPVLPVSPAPEEQSPAPARVAAAGTGGGRGGALAHPGGGTPRAIR